LERGYIGKEEKEGKRRKRERGEEKEEKEEKEGKRRKRERGEGKEEKEGKRRKRERGEEKEEKEEKRQVLARRALPSHGHPSQRSRNAWGGRRCNLEQDFLHRVCPFEVDHKSESTEAQVPPWGTLLLLRLEIFPDKAEQSSATRHLHL